MGLFQDEAYPQQKERQFVLTGIKSAKVEVTEALPWFSSGKEVEASVYKASFNKKTINVNKGEAAVVLGENPVYIEE